MSPVSPGVRRSCVLLSCALLLCLPAAGAAQETNAPPGNSAIDEYLETVPSASGDRPAAGGGQNQAEPAPLPPAAARALRGRGADGRAVADLVRESPASRRGRGSDAPPKVVAPGESPLGSIGRAVRGAGDSGGMGAALPAILLTALAALGGLVALRLSRRRSAS
jgi:hypothetical protein